MKNEESMNESINDRMLSSVPFLQGSKKVSSGDHANVLAGQPRKPFVTSTHFERVPLQRNQLSLPSDLCLFVDITVLRKVIARLHH
jgi:hypothetical protein